MTGWFDNAATGSRCRRGVGFLLPAGLLSAAFGLAACLQAGCGFVPPAGGNANANGDSPTGVPHYIGKAACVSCHSALIESHELHGHSQAMQSLQGVAPAYPEAATDAGVPAPPPSLAWSDVSYVLGGYSKAANFINGSGHLLFADPLMPNTFQQPLAYRIPLLALGKSDGAYVPADPGMLFEQAFTFGCFRCHVTGPSAAESNGGRRQDGRAGIGGTWAEAGVQCEACHGPGSVHVSNPAASNIVIDASVSACGQCHAQPGNAAGLAVDDEQFIIGYQQVGEVLASPHASFSCALCHNPHASTIHDRDNGLRNTCTTCHAGHNMAGHGGKIFVQGDYVERLSCESCHMPFASKSVYSAGDDRTMGLGGRLGDTRSHIMYIDTADRDVGGMLTDDGTAVRVDGDGHAAVTVDFACLRCHNGLGSAPAFNVPAASLAATMIHEHDALIADR